MKNTNWINPVIKFNGGIGAILCNNCYAVMKEKLTPEEFKGKTELLFCSDRCRKDYYLIHFPII